MHNTLCSEKHSLCNTVLMQFAVPVWQVFTGDSYRERKNLLVEECNISLDKSRILHVLNFVCRFVHPVSWRGSLG